MTRLTLALRLAVSARAHAPANRSKACLLSGSSLGLLLPCAVLMGLVTVGPAGAQDCDPGPLPGDLLFEDLGPRSCPWSWTTCPTGTGLAPGWNARPEGNVHVGIEYDFRSDQRDVDGDGAVEDYIDGCEFQCALDCLDGDPAPEHSLVRTSVVGQLQPPEVIPGGRLEMDAAWSYWTDPLCQGSCRMS